MRLLPFAAAAGKPFVALLVSDGGPGKAEHSGYFFQRQSAVVQYGRFRAVRLL
jgi:hypothetical protein